MLKTTITHPELLYSLAKSGHGSKILVADGNYPHNSGVHEAADRIALNVAPGLIMADAIIELLATTINVETAEFMQTADVTESTAVLGYKELLPRVPFVGVERFDFYDLARQSDVTTIIATGDTRQYANLLLTVGVVA